MPWGAAGRSRTCPIWPPTRGKSPHDRHDLRQFCNGKMRRNGVCYGQGKAPMRILIVEDEKKLSDILERSLKSEGYTVDGVHSAADGLEYVKSYHYDLIILDLQLPDGTGTSLLKRLRDMGHTMPVLILTARSDLDAKVENFQ